MLEICCILETRSLKNINKHLYFRGYWYLLDEYFMPGDENYEKSLINSQIYGALVLFVFHCGCSLHAGIYGDVSREKGGNMIEYYYTSYFYIKESTNNLIF